MKLLFFDLETTGFGFDKCAIIQIGAILIDLKTDMTLEPIDAVNLKMKPAKGKWIDRRALEINGISIDEMNSWQDPKIAYEKLIKFLDKHVDKFNKMDKIKLIGYNSMHFDIDFLRQFFKDNGDEFFGSYFWSDSIDVMSEASRYLTFYRPIMNSFKLGNVAKTLGIKIDEKSLHDGLYDIKLTYKIFKKIFESGKMFLEFKPEIAEEIFNEQMNSKDNSASRKNSSYTEETAWVQA